MVIEKDRLPEFAARFSEAFDYAAKKHSKQRRKGTRIPYVSHLMAVAGLVLENGGTEDEAVAALLHDAVEDQGGKATLEEIRQKFGDGVAGIVSGCTDSDVEPKPPWRQRKEHYLAHLRNADKSVRLVSSADKLHNARTILFDYREHGEKLWERFTARKDGQLWYYRQLVETFRGPDASPLVDELDRVVSEIERMARQPKAASA